jgi:hypothetical protein
MSTKTTPEVGDTVLYTLPDGDNAGTVRPALVVGESDMGNALDLEVFANRLADGPAYELGNVLRTGVAYGFDGGEYHAKGDKPAAKAKKKEA